MPATGRAARASVPVPVMFRLISVVPSGLSTLSVMKPPKVVPLSATVSRWPAAPSNRSRAFCPGRPRVATTAAPPDGDDAGIDIG